MSDLLAEVDEVMRQERLNKFWKENGTYIIVFIVGTILLTGIFSGYRAWDRSVKIEQTNQITALMDATDYPSNLLEAELNLHPNMEAIALLSGAATFMAQKKTDEAFILYQRVGENGKISDTMRHMAIIMSNRILATKEKIDASALLANLEEPLKDGSPWQSHARIEAAAIQANLNGNYETAKTLLNEVLDTQGLPPTLYERAQNLHHVYTLRHKQTTQPSQ